jgi:two-component sensor histidine kinase
MHEPGWSYETTLVAEPVSAPRARAFVCRRLVEHGLPYLVDPVRLVVSELATNAVVHARTAFTVTLSRADSTVLLAVRDESPAGPVPAQPGPPDIGGRGLRIVRMVSADCGVVSDRSGTRTVWASFALRQPQRR